MFFGWWRKLVRVESRISRCARRQPPYLRRAGLKPWAEVLEERTLLSNYTITDLGNLGGPFDDDQLGNLASFSEAYGINNAGEVVGISDESVGTTKTGKD